MKYPESTGGAASMAIKTKAVTRSEDGTSAIKVVGSDDSASKQMA